MKAIGIIAAIEAVLLTLAVGLFLHSERHTSFPASQPAPTPQAARTSAVPIRIDVVAGGVTTTAALVRGGAAAVVTANRDSGVVGFRVARAGQRDRLTAQRPEPIRSPGADSGLAP